MVLSSRVELDGTYEIPHRDGDLSQSFEQSDATERTIRRDKLAEIENVIHSIDPDIMEGNVSTHETETNSE
jgi:hypothetical protein